MDQLGATIVAERPHLPSQRGARASFVNVNRGNPTARASAVRSHEARIVEPTTPEEHRALMIRVAEARDKRAFEALFTHFGPRVKAYLMRSGSNPDSAEELAQEAMATVWRRADSFDPSQASAATWIFTIARNKRIDAYRRLNRPELDPEDPALIPQAEIAPDQVVEEGEMSDAIRSAVKTLPAEQADMLKMAFFEDKAHSEIAEETGLPLGTVKSRLRLAIARMRKQLKEFEE